MRRILLATLLVAAFTTQIPQANAALPATVPDRTPGAPLVTNDGIAAYEIPLSLPAGTGGLTPRLGLLYRHDGGRGILGMGWRVSGLSEITRCRYTRAQDGITGGVTVSATDRLCLDGKRLRLTSGSAYGAPGSTYQTEIETYARVSANGTAGNGAAWFRVESPDGLIYEYGNSADARILITGTTSARTWALNQIRDRYGNYVSFKYINDAANGSYRPDEILYTGNAQTGTAPVYSVKFNYDPSTEQFEAWVAGGYVRELYKLGSIAIQYQGTQLRKYELSYNTAAPPERHNLLLTVQECTSTANCRKPTTIDWTPLLNGWATPESAVVATSSPASSIPLDMNDDGYDDLAFFDSTTGTWKVTWGSATGSGVTVNTGYVSTGTPIALPTDLDSDGRTDLLIANGNTWWWLRQQATGSFAFTDTGTAANGAVSYSGTPAVTIADVDGDGYQDLVFGSGVAVGSIYVRFHNRDGSPGFEANSTVAYTPGNNVFSRALQAFNVRTPLRSIDVNGDGRQDVLLTVMPFCIACSPPVTNMVLVSTGTGFEAGPVIGSNAEVILPADMNGDGCTDFVVGADAGATSWKLRISKCYSSQLNAAVVVGVSATGALNALISDWNGDGLLDLVYPWKGKWRVLPFDGVTFSKPIDIDTPLASNLTDSRVADINGDGLLDLVYAAGGGIKSRLHAGPRGELVSAITDGFGVAARFNYAPMSDTAVYSRYSNAVLPQVDVGDNRMLVKELVATDGSGSGSTYTLGFTYAGARQDLLGRGFLGFAKRATSDSRSGSLLRQEENYLQQFPYTGQLATRVLTQSSGTKIREQVNTWTALTLGASQESRRFPYVANSIARNFELGGATNGTQFSSVASTVSAIDSASGLVTDASVTTTEVATGLNPASSRTERAQQTSLLNDQVNWCLGRAQATQITTTHTLSGGTTLTRRYAQTWDSSKCRPTQQQVEPGSAQWQVTVGLAYDAFGNLASQAVTGAGMPARTATVNWGSAGRFPEISTNALGEVVKRTFQASSGLIVSETDANGLTTSWQYDSFNQPMLETRADGSQTSWTLSAYACTTNCDARVRDTLTTTLRDSQAAIVKVDTVLLDQFGQGVEQRAGLPGGGTSATREERDARGRVLRRYVPYWIGASHNGYWQYAYDPLDRVTAARLYTAAGALDREVLQSYSGLVATATDARGNATVRTRSAWGEILRVVDAAGGSTRYQYDANGSLTQLTDAYGNVVSAITYGPTGHKLTHNDSDLGTWTFTPNALGELISQKNAKGQVTTFTYDALGRMMTRAELEGTSTWTWGRVTDNTANAKYVGRLKSMAGPGYSEAYAYDALARPATRTIAADNSYQYAYSYNAFGALDTLTYPASTAGVRVKLKYGYANGSVSSIRDYTADQLGTTYWQQNSVDQRGNVVDASLGNGLRVVSGFAPLTGLIDYRQSGTAGSTTNIQNLGYLWDANDNLRQRQDLRQSRTEALEHDALNRLDRSTLNGVQNLDVAYDLIGNVTGRSDVGAAAWTYHATKRHAVVTAGSNTYAYDANGNVQSRNGSSLSWYSYDLPASINSGSLTSQFSYTPERSRWRQTATYANGSETTIYVGGLMEKLTTGVRTHYRHYIPAPDGLVVILERRSDATADTFYVTNDHIGSTDAVLNGAGAIVSRQSFAPYGKRRGSDWSSTTPPDLNSVANSTRRGFTFHEQLDNLGLVHMNGRVYDPVIGRFLSADPYVSEPENGQSLNRYAYVWNNPMGLTDPTGYSPDGGGGPIVICNFVCIPDVREAPHVPMPPPPPRGWQDKVAPVLVGSADGIQTFCDADGCFLIEDYRTTSSRFWRGFNGERSLILDAEPSVPLVLGEVARGAVDTVNYVGGSALILLDLLNTAISPGPDAGIVGAAMIARASAPATVMSTSRALVPYYPTASGFIGATSRLLLRPGQTIDRYGGTAISRFFSPAGTTRAARSLPPATESLALRKFEVLREFEVEAGRVAPAFGKIGLGTQYKSGLTLQQLLEQGFIREIIP